MYRVKETNIKRWPHKFNTYALTEYLLIQRDCTVTNCYYLLSIYFIGGVYTLMS